MMHAQAASMKVTALAIELPSPPRALPPLTDAYIDCVDTAAVCKLAIAPDSAAQLIRSYVTLFGLGG